MVRGWREEKGEQQRVETEGGVERVDLNFAGLNFRVDCGFLRFYFR